MPTIKERTKHLELWIAEFGNRARHTIGTPEIDAVLSRSLTAGLSPSTARNRRTVLLHLWNRLDGPDAQNPVRRALKPRHRNRRPGHLATSRLSRSSRPCRISARGWQERPETTLQRPRRGWPSLPARGLPHSLLKRLRPADVDWKAKTMAVSARRKGKGVARRVLPLTDAGLDALRRFAELECWGAFSNSSLWKSFNRACEAVGLTGIVPMISGTRLLRCSTCGRAT